MRIDGRLYRRRRTPTTDEIEIGRIDRPIVKALAMLIVAGLLVSDVIDWSDIVSTMRLLRPPPVEMQEGLPAPQNEPRHPSKRRERTSKSVVWLGDAKLLESAGLALFGPCWLNPLAGATRVHPRT